jgi:pimeloyl-ACP methyl ester carboxylesterase
MPKVKVNDIQMCYEVKGEGFPLVMIVGAEASLDWWNPHMIEELSKNFKVVTFDNRGTGRTDVSDKEFSIKLFADDTVGLMNVLGISQADILGWSMGGFVAQELALNYPEKVKKLILYSTSCGGVKSVPRSKEAAAMLMAVAHGGMSSEEAVRMYIRPFCTSEFIDNNPDFVELIIQRMLRVPTSPEVCMRQSRAIMSFDSYDRLPRIKVPTLILSGKRDITCPPENGSILAEAIPNAKLVFFEKSAHTLNEDMEEVIHTITEFLL